MIIVSNLILFGALFLLDLLPLFTQRGRPSGTWVSAAMYAVSFLLLMFVGFGGKLSLYNLMKG